MDASCSLYALGTLRESLTTGMLEDEAERPAERDLGLGAALSGRLGASALATRKSLEGLRITGALAAAEGALPARGVVARLLTGVKPSPSGPAGRSVRADVGPGPRLGVGALAVDGTGPRLDEEAVAALEGPGPLLEAGGLSGGGGGLIELPARGHAASTG